MPKFIAYLETSCAELKQMIAESEAKREVAPYWLVEAQMNAAIMNHMANAQHDTNF